VAERLSREGLLGEVREYRHRVGHCDRCGTVIEPWLSEQWWVAMEGLARPAIEALEKGEIRVYPDSWRLETTRWLENIHDWNVSRQLWWGHRIPVWYGPDGEVVASKSRRARVEQDPDILDTWFSSGLWPFATLGWPEENEDLEYFYPTSLLSTAREIMYLWVARMIMMGLRFRGNVPFEKVNVHSIVLAEDGTKMSKSKGNTIDPLDLFEEYGTDAVRFGLLYQSSTQDFAYSYERAAMGRAFVTKLWNATRFILNYPENGEAGEMSVSDRWILSEFNRTAREYDRLLEECEFSEAMRLIYGFAWNQFADWYIEIAKAAPSPETPRVLREVFLGTSSSCTRSCRSPRRRWLALWARRGRSPAARSRYLIPPSRTRGRTRSWAVRGGRSRPSAPSGQSRRSTGSSRGGWSGRWTRRLSPASRA
jgi:valyl-tRNA synthetase